jgi:hypothetical protein
MIDVIEDEDFYLAAGRIAYSSARMSAAIEELIMGMLATEGMAVLTADLSFAQVNHVAHALADRLIRGKQELATLNSILDEAGRWYAMRNKVMHGEWGGGEGYYFCIRARARGKLEVYEEEFSIDELFEVATGLEQCRAKLERFTGRKRFLERTMFDEDVGVQRLWRRTRIRDREKARIKAKRP